MFYRILMTILCASYFLAHSAYAAEKMPAYLDDPRGKNFTIPKLNNDDPRSRLAKPGSDQFDDIGNVVIAAVEPTKIPSYIAKQIEIAGDECVDGNAPSNRPDVYSYETDYHRKSGNAPNYFVDYSKWADQKFKKCHLNMICERQNCTVIGYTSLDKSQWQPTSPLLGIDWAVILPQGQVFHNINNLSDVPMITDGALFMIKSVGMPCAQDSFKNTDSGCSDLYRWDNDGINVVTVR